MPNRDFHRVRIVVDDAARHAALAAQPARQTVIRLAPSSKPITFSDAAKRAALRLLLES